MNKYIRLALTRAHAISRRVHFFLTIILAALLMLNIPITPVQAAAGDLDSGFGQGGRVTTDFGFIDGAHGVAIQQDGKIVAVGLAFGVNPFTVDDFALARYNANGSLDSTFGNGGKVTTDFFGHQDDAFAVAIQSDGKIIAAGSAENSSGSGSAIAVVRYNPNGSLDSAFGNGGKAIVDLGARSLAFSVVLQSNGKIVVAGDAGQTGFLLARFNSDGHLDSSFGSTFGIQGLVRTQFGDGLGEGAFALALQADGKLVAGGYVSNSSTIFDFALARYNSDGTLDSTFGTNGKVITDFLQHSDFIRSLAIQSDGKIVAAGTVGVGSDAVFSKFAAARYNSNGSLDVSFGTGGLFSVDTLGWNITANAVALQKNGKIVLAGSGTGDFVVARLNTNGKLDPSFGSGGIIATDFADPLMSGDQAFALAIQPDGKIVAAGVAFSFSGSSDNFALARYEGDPPGPTFDVCLQDDSNSNLLQFNSDTGEYQFTNCSGLVIGGTGTLTKRGSVITLQHNASDRRVMARIDGSINKATASIQILSQGLNFTITDRNTANNTCACR